MLLALSLLALPFLTAASPVQPRAITSIIAQPSASTVTFVAGGTATTTFDGAISTGTASPEGIISGSGSPPLSYTTFASGSGVSSATGSGCPAFETGGPSSHLGIDGTVTVSLPQASQVTSYYTSVSGSPVTVSGTVVASPVSVGSGPAPHVQSFVTFSSGADSNSASFVSGFETTTYAESSRPTTTIYLAPSAFTTSGCYTATKPSNYSATVNGTYSSTSASSNVTATALKQLAGQSSGAGSTFGAKGAAGALIILGAVSAAALL